MVVVFLALVGLVGLVVRSRRGGMCVCEQSCRYISCYQEDVEEGRMSKWLRRTCVRQLIDRILVRLWSVRVARSC
jgi:hypothetical protein